MKIVKQIHSIKQSADRIMVVVYTAMAQIFFFIYHAMKINYCTKMPQTIKYFVHSREAFYKVSFLGVFSPNTRALETCSPFCKHTVYLQMNRSSG